jgi:hypothetical protein
MVSILRALVEIIEQYMTASSSHLFVGAFVTLEYDEKEQIPSGIVDWLGSDGKTTQWTNPFTNGTMKITYDGCRGCTIADIILENNSQPPRPQQYQLTSKYTTHHRYSEPQRWTIMIDLIEASLRPTHYSLCTNASTSPFINGWMLSGSDDGKKWIELDHRTGPLHNYVSNRVSVDSSDSLPQRVRTAIGIFTFGSALMEISNNYYRYYRLTGMSLNVNPNTMIGIELYGNVRINSSS